MNAYVSCEVEVASHHKRLYYMAWLRGGKERERIEYYEKFIKNPPTPTTSG